VSKTRRTSPRRRRGIKNLLSEEIKIEHVVDSALVGIIGGVFYDLVKTLTVEHALPTVLALVTGGSR
jgi:hypothetical protein